jgi:hypothetical protein
MTHPGEAAQRTATKQALVNEPIRAESCKFSGCTQRRGTQPPCSRVTVTVNDRISGAPLDLAGRVHGVQQPQYLQHRPCGVPARGSAVLGGRVGCCVVIIGVCDG